MSIYKPCQLVGIFPRSPELIKATRDFDRGRCKKGELERIRREDVKRLIKYQKDFEYIIDGGLLWQDILRPFTTIKGIEEGPLVRFFKTNTFYRRPIIKGRVEFESEFIERFFYLDLIPERMKVNLPGPISLFYLSEDRYKRDTPFMIAEILSEVSKHLERRGVESIQFLEPGVSPEINSEFWREIYGIVTENLRVETSIHLYFTDVSEIREVFDFPVDGIGIDFVSTSVDNLKINTSKKVGIGYIDAQNSLLEDTEEVISFVKGIVKRLGLKRFYLCPNCALDFLPYSVALRKLEILEEAGERLKG